MLSDATAPEVGRLVVIVDGRKWKAVRTTTGLRTIKVSRALVLGRHTVRVRFRPTDRSAFSPSRSRVKRIVVSSR